MIIITIVIKSRKSIWCGKVPSNTEEIRKALKHFTPQLQTVNEK